mmetsp:Transcript_7420/g.15997  ORF Transcript_7420/g.15997 Transcript_7420/m.15997 type:complete len:85 (-) Transcript_7420:244-498(-)
MALDFDHICAAVLFLREKICGITFRIEASISEHLDEQYSLGAVLGMSKVQTNCLIFFIVKNFDQLILHGHSTWVYLCWSKCDHL